MSLIPFQAGIQEDSFQEMGIPAWQVPEGMQGHACRDNPEEVWAQHLPTIPKGFQRQHSSFCRPKKQLPVTHGGEWEPKKAKFGFANADIPAQSSGNEAHGLS